MSDGAADLTQRHITLPGRRTFAMRVAAFFGALFLIYGIVIPYLPVWLDSRGLTAAEIGMVMSTPYVLRLVFTPGVAIAADRYGDHRLALVILGWLALCAVVALGPVSGFWPIFLLAVPFLLLTTTMMPLTETVAVGGVRTAGLDYGRMRLWGSLTFIAASFAGGAAVDRFGTSAPIYMLMAGAAATVAAAHLLPRRQRNADTPAVTMHTDVARYAARLLSSRPFLVFLLAAGAIQGAHATFYTFGAVHWRANGISTAWVGSLWAIGVIAEVIVFAYSAALAKRFGAVQLLIAGGAASVLRWTIMAFDPPLSVLVPFQVLHGLTYGASHIGAIHFISKAVPEAATGSAQAFYATIASGVAHGCAIMLSGVLYETYGAMTYLAMTVMSGTGLIASLALLGLWKGGELWPSAAPAGREPRAVVEPPMAV
jgi:PPP family 3-phenylpropionic acid transporter